MTITDTISFITSEAGEEDLNQIFSALKLRRQVLGQIKASAVSEGMKVTLEGLSPKYLNGLSGVIVERNGARVAVQLDERSTQMLRFSGQKRFFVPLAMTAYRLEGIPAQCAKAVG